MILQGLLQSVFSQSSNERRKLLAKFHGMERAASLRNSVLEKLIAGDTVHLREIQPDKRSGPVGRRQVDLENFTQEWWLDEMQLLCDLIAVNHPGAVRDMHKHMSFSRALLGQGYTLKSVAAWSHAVLDSCKVGEWRAGNTSMELVITICRLASHGGRRSQRQQGQRQLTRHQRQVCRQWAQGGGCTYGNNCRFAHHCPVCEGQPGHKKADCPRKRIALGRTPCTYPARD